MLTKFDVRWNGAVPILMHNGQLANPRNPIVQAIKKITSLPPKQKSTDENLLRLATLEWVGGLYFTGDVAIGDKIAFSPKAKVIIPADVIYGCVVSGARKQRLGELMQSSFLIDDDATFEYEGPKDLNVLMQDDRYISIRRAGVKGSAVMRTRPIFKTWQISFSCMVDTESIDEKSFIQAMRDAGRYKGVGDYSPRFGRFWVEEVTNTGVVE